MLLLPHTIWFIALLLMKIRTGLGVDPRRLSGRRFIAHQDSYYASWPEAQS